MWNKVTLILLALTLLSSCNRDNGNKEQSKIIQLEVQNSYLTTGLQNTQKLLRELKQNDGTIINQQIIVEAATFTDESDTLELVRDRKILLCGGNADLPGFGYLDPDSSEFVGFDVDICRAIAAAVLGPEGADLVEVIPLTSKLRFAALQTGEIDVLSRNTTWTMSRDTELRADFATITFYDGQGVLVRKSDEILKLSDFDKRSICVQSGSTSANNVATYFEDLGLNIEIRNFDDRITALKQYESGGCDGYTGDKSSLISQQSLLEDPKQHVILGDQISREPLGPAVRHKDNVWKDIVTWTVQCLLNAEQMGISQKTVSVDKNSPKIAVQRLLGVTGDLGEKLGLTNDFCYNAISQVGNYKDIYDRHLGPETPFNLVRGQNALVSGSGLHYPLPFQ